MTPQNKKMTDGCRTVGTLAARALMDFALSRGCSLAVLSEQSCIKPADLRDAEGRIPFARYAALMQAAKKMCNDPAFALHFGESDAGVEATFACMMGIFSPTMSESLTPDHGESNGLQLKRDGEEVWIIDTQNDGFPEGPEASFARAVCAARRLFPGAEFVKALHFRHAEPQYRAEYDRIFRMPIVFDSDRNAVLADASWLDRRLAPPSQRAFEIVKGRAENMISTRSRVESMLTNLLPAGGRSIAAVADKLGMGRHTLFRRLRAEGVTFKQVVDEMRHKLAIHYLSEQKLTVNETAYLLGFSDSTALSRAYKRWTGHSPRGVK